MEVKLKKVILDTNHYLRFLLNDIPAQTTKVTQILEQAQKNTVTILVPQIVIFELHFVLEKFYQFGKIESIEKLKSLITAPYLQVESRDIFLTALTIYQKAQTSLPDCFLVAQAQHDGAELVTFDQKLSRLFHTSSLNWMG